MLEVLTFQERCPRLKTFQELGELVVSRWRKGSVLRRATNKSALFEECWCCSKEGPRVGWMGQDLCGSLCGLERKLRCLEGPPSWPWLAPKGSSQAGSPRRCCRVLGFRLSSKASRSATGLQGPYSNSAPRAIWWSRKGIFLLARYPCRRG